MAFTTLVLLAVLSAAPTQNLPSATVMAGGHAYQLFCAQAGELIVESETGLCGKTESGGVQHFEVRNEDGDVQFSQDAPEGKPFTYVAIFAVANAGREVLDVDTAQDDNPAGGSKATHLIYYFDPGPSHLIPFDPPMVGVDGFAHVGQGLALSRTFDTGYFQFSLLLGFNMGTHRIEVMPDQNVFSALPPPGRQKSGPVGGSGELKLYSGHDIAAAKTPVQIKPGHAIDWWQAPGLGGKAGASQVVTILSAWAPASLKPADNAPDGVKMVYFDWNNLWLQIEVDDHMGWIKGSASFRMIGLQMEK